jgi:hypothetical protein
VGVPKDAPAQEPAPAKSEPSRLEVLRAKFAELQKRVPGLTVERVEPSKEAEEKGHVTAKWGRTRVSHVVEPPYSIDQSEAAVLEVVIAQLTVS